MNRRPHDDVVDLSAALAWLRTAWHTLPAPPSRLHDRDIEDGSVLGAHRFSYPFWKILSTGAYATVNAVETVQCSHNRLKGENVFDCLDCHGVGHYENHVSRYRSPMAAALAGLAKSPRPSDGTRAPIDFVMALYYGNWNIDRASRYVGIPIISPDHRITVEAMFLLSLRRLRHRYSEAPMPRVERKSAAQLDAEAAA